MGAWRPSALCLVCLQGGAPTRDSRVLPPASFLSAIPCHTPAPRALCSELWHTQMARVLPDPKEPGAEPSKHGDIAIDIGDMMNALGTHRPLCLMSTGCSECSTKAML